MIRRTSTTGQSNPPSRKPRTITVKGPAKGPGAPKANASAAAGKGTVVKTAAKTVVRKSASPVKKVVVAKKTQNAAVKTAVRKGVVKQKAEQRLSVAPKVRMITGEYLLAISLALIALVYTDGTYATKVRTFIVQFTGISAVFFVMSLTGLSEKAAKVSIAFGALIDLAILLHVFKVKKAAVPTGTELKTESDPFWTTDPNGVAQGNTANATPTPGAAKGNTQNAAPPPLHKQATPT